MSSARPSVAGCDLQHRPDQPHLLDVEAAAEQGQRLELEIQALDLEAHGIRRAGHGGLAQGQRRLGQQIEVDAALDRDALPGHRFRPGGQLVAVVVPDHQARNGHQASGNQRDQQNRNDDQDAQGESGLARARIGALEVSYKFACFRPATTAGPPPRPHARGCARWYSFIRRSPSTAV